MRIDEDFSTRERREREALEESDSIPRVTLATSDGQGWKWTTGKVARWVSIGLVTAGAVWASIASSQTPIPVPTSRVCRPLIIGDKPCGKLCKLPDRWAIRGCKPLNKLIAQS